MPLKAHLTGAVKVCSLCGHPNKVIAYRQAGFDTQIAACENCDGLTVRPDVTARKA